MRNPFRPSSSRHATAADLTKLRPPSEGKTPWILQWLSMSVLCGTGHVHHEAYDEISRACRLAPRASSGPTVPATRRENA